MTSLSNLSTELLISIVSDLPVASFPFLSLTNRRLHHIANPRLYESIYFWGTGNKDTTERVFEEGEYGELYGHQKAPVGASRIYDLDILTQTLLLYPQLASHVKRVEMTWGADENMEDDMKVLRFLDITKYMQLDTLALAPPNLYFRVPTHAAVTTLRIRHKSCYGGSDSEVAPDVDQLHRQCCIPSVNEVSVDGWLYWSESVGFTQDPNAILDSPLPRAKTSSITVLRIYTLGAPGYIFNDILSWPTDLRVFHFECHPYIGWGEMYQTPGRVSSEDFIGPLQQCCSTLEELSIRCYVGENDGEPCTSTPIDLRAFTNLKRLRIRHDFLLMSLPNRQYDIAHLGPTPPRLYEVLPRSLEQLHLEIGEGDFTMWEDDPNVKVDENVYWLFDTLEELALHKTGCLPRLTRVVSGECPYFDYCYYFSNIMDDCERGRQVKDAFAREKIQFSCWISDDEPRVFDESE